MHGQRLGVFAFAGLLIAVPCGTSAQAQPGDLPGWELVWNDEFDGPSLNTQNWVALDRRDSFNNEQQYYHPDQVEVSNGFLNLTAINTPRAGKAYQSGLVTSQDLFGPGRFEARIDLPTSQGMWPAFWLNANHVAWPQGGEIDIMENRGSQPNLVSSAYHWQTNPGPCCDQHRYVYHEHTATQDGQGVDYHAGFHTYAAEWDETSIQFYVDGQLHFTVSERPDRPIFETPKNIILNLAVGGIFGGNPDATTLWPQTMQVDYVRYWQRSGEQPEPEPEPDGNLLLNASFEEGGGSLTGWNTFGNTVPNVAASDSLANDGSNALKIFGQFNGTENTSGVSQGVTIQPGDRLLATASTHSPGWDTLLGKSNEVTMKIEFYSQPGAEYNSASFLGEVSQLIHDGSTAADLWHDHTLEAIAPDNAVEARYSLLFSQPANENGAIWIDSTGLFLQNLLPGDYNDDGIVNAQDYALWRENLGGPADTLCNNPHTGPIGSAHYTTWRTHYGTSADSPAPPPAPEPAACMLLCLGSWLLATHRKHATG